MELEIKVTIALPSIAQEVWEEASREYFKNGKGDNSWSDLIDAKENILKMKSYLDRFVSEGGKPNYMTLFFNRTLSWPNEPGGFQMTMGKYQPEDFERLVFTPSSLAIPYHMKEKHEERSKFIRTCPGCGNEYVDWVENEKYLKKAHAVKLPVFSVGGFQTFLFAREEFLIHYEREGLTGLDFEDLGRGLYRILFHFHKFSGKGICKTCGMKTNIAMPNLLYCDEHYPLDFQGVRLNPGGKYIRDIYYVLSPRAVRFLRGFNVEKQKKLGLLSADMNYCRAPIIPGYRNDILGTEERLFTNGDYPQSVYKPD